METSAKQRVHVEDSFYEVVREIRRMNKREQENSRAKPGQRDQYELEKDNGGCCGCVLM
jgi:GTPase KRas protein